MSDIPGLDDAQAKHDGATPPERERYKCDVCGGVGRPAAAECGDDCVDNCECHKADAHMRDTLNALAGSDRYLETVHYLRQCRVYFRNCDRCEHRCTVCSGTGEV